MRRAARPFTDQRRGFTLLEMIAALALVSVITLSLYASLRIAFTVRGSAEAAVALARAADAAAQQVRLDIESAAPPVGILAADFFGEPGVNTLGLDNDYLLVHTTTGLADIDYDGLTLSDRGAAYSRRNLGSTGADLQRVEYQLVPDPQGGEGYALVRFVTKNLTAQTRPIPHEQLLARNVRALSLRYYDYGSGWHERWESELREGRLPDAVEIVIELSDETGRRHRAVQLVRPPAAGADTAGLGNRIIR